MLTGGMDSEGTSIQTLDGRMVHTLNTGAKQAAPAPACGAVDKLYQVMEDTAGVAN